MDLEPEERSGGSVRILVRYMGSIYVRPGGARDDVVLLSAAPDAAENGQRKLSIMLHNRGGAHVILRNLRLSLAAETQAPGPGCAGKAWPDDIDPRCQWRCWYSVGATGGDCGTDDDRYRLNS